MSKNCSSLGLDQIALDADEIFVLCRMATDDNNGHTI